MSYFNSDTEANELFDTVIENKVNEENDGNQEEDEDEEEKEEEEEAEAAAAAAITRTTTKPSEVRQKQTKSNKNRKKRTSPRKTAKAVFEPNALTEDEENDNDNDDDYIQLPAFSGFALHNVSAGEEDANQGTEAALLKLKALSLHASPKLSVKFGAQQDLYMRDVFQKRSTTHPTYMDMIISAIRNIDIPKGVSIVAIKKWIKANYPETSTVSINANMKRAIKKGMDDGTFKRPNRSSDSLGSSLVGSIVLNHAKKGVAPKPKIRAEATKPKPATKKAVTQTSKEEPKNNNGADENEAKASETDHQRKPEAVSKAKLPKKTTLKETAAKAKPKKPLKQPTHEAIKEEPEKALTNDDHDEILENKENQRPVKSKKKTPATAKKPGETVTKNPKTAKGKKVSKKDPDVTEKPLTRSAEKQLGMSQRLRSTK